MAIEISFDDSRGARSEREGQASREVRMATVSGLDTTGVGPEAALVQLWNHPRMPQPGTPHPANPNALYRRGAIFGVGASGAARVELVYDSFAGGTPSVSIIRILARNEVVSTSIMPGSRIPFRVSLQKNVDPQYYCSESTVTFRYKMPAPVVSVFKLSQGSLDLSNAGAQTSVVGHVNDSKWMNREKGHWLLDDYQVEISQYAGFFTTRATAIAHPQPLQDWSDTEVAYNNVLGKLAKVNDSDIAAEAQRPYKFGVITPPDVNGFFSPDLNSYINAQWQRGFIRVGMYPLTSFSSVFGFEGNVEPSPLPL